MASSPYRRYRFALVALAALACSAASAQPTEPDVGLGPGAELTLLYEADDRFAAAEYGAASVAYEAFLRDHPDTSQASWARLRLGYSLFFQGDIERAESTFSFASEQDHGTTHGTLAALMLAESRYRAGLPRRALGEYRRIVERTDSSAVSDEAHYRMGAILLHQAQWHAAAGEFAAVSSEHGLYGSARELVHLSRDGVQIPRRSPSRSGWLSALVPGAGLMYADRPWKGVVAFLLTGVTAWGAVEAFGEDEELVGGAIGGVSLLLYGQSIRSSIAEAETFNARSHADYLNELARLHPLDRPPLLDPLEAGPIAGLR